MSLVEDYISEYLDNMLTDCEGELGELQRRAYKEGLPIIPKDVVKLLGFIIGIKKPKAILEIGMAVGFSSSYMAQFLSEDGYIKTIDRYPMMIERAKENFKKFGLEDKITILEGNANDVLKGLDESKYLLTEIQAPNGYSGGVTKEVTIDVNEDGNASVVTYGGGTSNIINTKLSALPSTGGIGTTIFTIGGCVIMIAAAGLFFATRKKAEK